VTGEFSESSNNSGEIKDREGWTFKKAAFASGWVQDSALIKNVTKSGGSYSYDGSGSYTNSSTGISGKYSQDYRSKSDSTDESKVEKYDGKTWTFDWHGGSTSDSTNNSAYSGSGSSSYNPPDVTLPFRTEEANGTSQFEEDYKYKSHAKVTTTWTSDPSGNKSTSNSTDTSSLVHEHTASSGTSHSKIVEWSNVASSGFGAISKQITETENDTSFKSSKNLCRGVVRDIF